MCRISDASAFPFRVSRLAGEAAPRCRPMGWQTCCQPCRRRSARSHPSDRVSGFVRLYQQTSGRPVAATLTVAVLDATRSGPHRTDDVLRRGTFRARTSRRLPLRSAAGELGAWRLLAASRRHGQQRDSHTWRALQRALSQGSSPMSSTPSGTWPASRSTRTCRSSPLQTPDRPLSWSPLDSQVHEPVELLEVLVYSPGTSRARDTSPRVDGSIAWCRLMQRVEESVQSDGCRRRILGWCEPRTLASKPGDDGP